MLDFFFSQYKNVPVEQIALEAVAFLFGIWSVLLAKKERIAVFPVGIVSTVITVYFMHKAGYFADMAINIYYTLMSLYGWYIWGKKTNDKQLEISYLSKKGWVICFLIFIVAFLGCLGLYKVYNAKIEVNNFIDIFTTSMFFCGMWLMSHKKIENWIFYMIADFLLIPILWQRGMPIFAIQYFIFAILAFIAYKSWKKSGQKKIYTT